MLKRKFQDILLKQKIQLLVIFCICLISITALCSLHIVSRAHEKVLYNTLSSNLSYSALEVSECLEQTVNLADSIFSDPLVQEHLPLVQDADTPTLRQYHANYIYNILNNHLFNESNQFISYIAILQDDLSSIHTYSPPLQSVPKATLQRLVNTGKAHAGESIWVTDYCQEYGLFLVKQIREAKDFSFRSLGVMVINIVPHTLIAKSTAFNSKYDALSWLLLDGDDLLYPASSPTDIHVTELKDQLNKGYDVLKLNGQPVFAVHGMIPGYDWDYICTVSYNSIANTLTATWNICVVVLILSILLTVFVSSQILSSVTCHVDKLLDKIHRFGSGDYKPVETNYDYSQRKDEIGQLHTTFDSMAAKVDTLITENYTNELLKKEAQLRALESQMDPHFLYNTLDSINWRAKAIQAKDIALITTSLGNLLRISLSKTKSSFTIAQEMNIVENYIAIQKLRYPNRLAFTMDIPEEFRDYQIPKFTIQPLLENAIRYGLEEISEICYISVTAFSSDKKLLIEVKNNGSQFEDQLLRKLGSQELSPHGFGIGLLNIHKRLQITYGLDYGLYLYNMEDEYDGEEYAIAQIQLPLMKGDTENV